MALPWVGVVGVGPKTFGAWGVSTITLKYEWKCVCVLRFTHAFS